jgi:biopolymer transport protein ExbD
MKKEDKEGPIVLIKAEKGAKYKDMVSAIDEMAICNIASYAVIDVSPLEVEMLKTAPK